MIAYEQNDLVGIFYGNSNHGTAVADVSTTPVTMKLNTSEPIAEGTGIYAYYPYRTSGNSMSATSVAMRIPVRQFQNSDFYDADAMPMASLPAVLEDNAPTGTAGKIYMCNLAAVAEFNIYSSRLAYTNEKVVSVTVESENAVAGDFVYDITSMDGSDIGGIPELADRNVTTSVSAPAAFGTSKDKAARVYMVLRPGPFAGIVKVRTDVAEYVLNVTKEILFSRFFISHKTKT